MVDRLIDIGGDIRDVNTLTVPASRAFRNAWQYNGSVIEIDMALAREIHKDKLRLERLPMLEALDTDWFRATEAGDAAAQSAVAAQKQVLRNITEDARIASAATPEELSALTLDGLVG